MSRPSCPCTKARLSGFAIPSMLHSFNPSPPAVLPHSSACIVVATPCSSTSSRYTAKTSDFSLSIPRKIDQKFQKTKFLKISKKIHYRECAPQPQSLKGSLIAFPPCDSGWSYLSEASPLSAMSSMPRRMVDIAMNIWLRSGSKASPSILLNSTVTPNMSAYLHWVSIRKKNSLCTHSVGTTILGTPLKHRRIFGEWCSQNCTWLI